MSYEPEVFATWLAAASERARGLSYGQFTDNACRNLSGNWCSEHQLQHQEPAPIAGARAPSFNVPREFRARANHHAYVSDDGLATRFYTFAPPACSCREIDTSFQSPPFYPQTPVACGGALCSAVANFATGESAQTLQERFCEIANLSVTDTIRPARHENFSVSTVGQYLSTPDEFAYCLVSWAAGVISGSKTSSTFMVLMARHGV